jgi:hypothetical protein
MAWGQERAQAAAGEDAYTLHFSGGMEGTVVIRRDSAGKLTVTPALSDGGIYYITHELCPLIPEWAGDVWVNENLKETVIDGNTLTASHADGSWEKTVVDGSTTTTTYADGHWEKSVVDGGATTRTDSNGWWLKSVVDGNTTTTTYAGGAWLKSVVDGNTTTITRSDGGWWKTVVDGGATTETDSYGWWEKTVVDKQGYDIFIHRESGYRESGEAMSN